MRRLSQAIQQRAQGAVDEIRQAFRGVLHLVKSADNIQKVQASGLADETLQDVELMQQFGFTSVPPANTQAVILPIGGQTTHGIVIATENGSFRLKNLQGGEVAIYDESGSSIVLKKGRLIEIDCDVLKINATTKVDISSPLVETDQVFTAQGQINGNGGMAVQGGSGASFTGNVQQSGGSFTTDGDVKAGIISLSNHKHTGDSGGKTSKPE
ncbi:TPA: phage baseplate assembly protein V [Haemophilus influenzae]|uniref:Bacteriophage Mu Gp45 protein n=1 Tax=Haemophilus influenzae TaxID=727 RepID=A0A2S9S0W1_HAEIF|nr:phage baseplate assembly protein V [Haemophilus influenzae]KMZ33369.1 baseplate assembly protein [Haemophilus influenzae]MCK8934688.1 phage baseplate assembly protein V [Haemophilus influenzae]MCK8993541.1 phage baseplate assembly protein V [Haemophilus influenzae]MCK9057895.1 phage baseplate assembly protein V [Haemophilus influenzae]MCK9059369.1 phage baseplate assembly protein V [Haemophilus influenzae]